MENNQKYIHWIIFIIVLIIISISIIWYFRKPKKLDIIENIPYVEGLLIIEEVICKI